jgi:superfamily II DNA or RNA helicase
MKLHLNPSSIDDYRKFLAAKRLPRYRVTGRSVEFPDEYAAMMGVTKRNRTKTGNFEPSPFLFDYQRAIVDLAVRKRKFCVFADCGLGKTLIMLDFAIAASMSRRRSRVLIVSPLMVCRQTAAEWERFYGRGPLPVIAARDLPAWLKLGDGIAITNYEAITDELPDAKLDGLILDESSMLKSHYGAWGTRLIELGRGVEWKMCLTGTPAPNDRIEYANHAVFMDAFPTVNSFLARFFVNRGQTQERWEMKSHAVAPFYRAVSHWCIFLSNPSVYGWRDNCDSIPPIRVHVENVSSTDAQRSALMDTTGTMFVTEAGGIGSRAKIARIGKGFHDGEKIDSHKTTYIADRIASWPNESTLVWCKYNAEQEEIAAAIPGCGNITGETPIEERQRIIDAFKRGEIRTLVTKTKILGFGLNLQIATRQVFSTLQDSYEEFYQAVKRSNRIGSTKPLDVHIPVTEFERPMIETVLAKAHRVQADTEEQERIFREHAQIKENGNVA